MGRISEKVIAILLLAFMLSYVGYQMYVYYYNPLQFETAFEYSVSQTLTVDGLVVRQESVIEKAAPSGLESSAVQDGTRVALGETVVEYFSSTVSDAQIQRMHELEKEILALEDAQNPVTSHYSNADTFTRNIRDQVGELAGMSSTGRFYNMDDVRSDMVALMNKKQVSIGKETSYQSRINTLRSEYDRVASSVNMASIDKVTAPVAGFFVSTVDGYESYMLDSFSTYTISNYRNMLENDATRTTTRVGKIVTSPEWYYITLVSKYDVQWMKAGHSVTIQFDNVDDPVPGTVDSLLFENGEDDAILIIRVNHVSGDLLKLRYASAIIHVDQYSGLRINRSSIRFQDDQMGVFIMYKRTVQFKKIDPIYEESGFVISRISGEPDTVSQFDQIITKGVDLYDGKVIE